MEDEQLLLLLPLLFPIFFAALWLFVTTLLAYLSGWYRLMEHFPDRPEKPTLHLTWQTGLMAGFVSMRGVLKLSVCESGLRIGILRAFGPFSRNIFVPWDKLEVERKTFLGFPTVELRFDRPSKGRLTVRAAVADKLAHAAVTRWPEGRLERGRK